MLERGQKLDELVDKTDKLSGTSKAFYKEVYGSLVGGDIAAFPNLYCRPEEGRVVSYSDSDIYFFIVCLFC